MIAFDLFAFKQRPFAVALNILSRCCICIPQSVIWEDRSFEYIMWSKAPRIELRGTPFRTELLNDFTSPLCTVWLVLYRYVRISIPVDVENLKVFSTCDKNCHDQKYRMLSNVVEIPEKTIYSDPFLTTTPLKRPLKPWRSYV